MRQEQSIITEEMQELFKDVVTLSLYVRDDYIMKASEGQTFKAEEV